MPYLTAAEWLGVLVFALLILAVGMLAERFDRDTSIDAVHQRRRR